MCDNINGSNLTHKISQFCPLTQAKMFFLFYLLMLETLTFRNLCITFCQPAMLLGQVERFHGT